jgi:3-methyladenine DNA glycosylase AlkC
VTFNAKDYPAPQELVDAMERTGEVLRAVHHERRRQDALVKQGKFSWNCGDPRVPWSEKIAVLLEEVGEASREVVEWMISRDKYAADPQLKVMPPHREKYFRDRLRTELVQIAAVCVAFAESLADEGEQGPR